MIAQVEVESEQTEPLDRIQAAFVSCPQVQQCYNATGDCDVLIMFVVRDNDNVKRFKTLVVLDRNKVSLDVPVE